MFVQQPRICQTDPFPSTADQPRVWAPVAIFVLRQPFRSTSSSVQQFIFLSLSLVQYYTGRLCCWLAGVEGIACRALSAFHKIWLTPMRLFISPFAVLPRVGISSIQGITAALLFNSLLRCTLPYPAVLGSVPALVWASPMPCGSFQLFSRTVASAY